MKNIESVGLDTPKETNKNVFTDKLKSKIILCCKKNFVLPTSMLGDLQ